MNEYYDLAVQYLSDYIKINTCNPPGNTDKAVEFWKNIYEQENIRYEIYEKEKGKKSICGFITECAPNKKRLLLLNHMDVVPADEVKWQYSPFSGEYDNEYIYGRGTIDMKGLAVVQLAVALYIRRNNIIMNRDICILSVPDEETGGFFGAKYIVNDYLTDLNPFAVLDEGTFAIRNNDRITFYVSYSQKKTLWLKICAYGKESHGACPTQDNANNILIKALGKVCRNPFTHHGILIDETLSDTAEGICLKDVLMNDTISVTSVKSESAPNVKPMYAEAVLDCRLMPETKVEEFMHNLMKSFDDDRIQFQVIKRTDKVACSDANHEIIGFIRDAVTKHFPDVAVETIVSPVGTDSKYFRDAGVESYGIFPIILSLDELKMMHGTDEKLSIYNLKIAIDIYKDILYNYAKEKMRNGDTK